MPAYADAVQRLTSHQKTSKGAPAYSLYVNRPLGRRLAAAAFVLGRTPDQVTALSAAFSFTGIAVLALGRPSPGLALSVTLLLVVGYALDSADGQLARLRGGGSPAGEWLDHVIDSAKVVSLHAAVLVLAHREGQSDLRLLVPLAFAVVASTWFFTIVLTDQLRRAHPRPAAPPRRASLLRSLLALPTDYGVLCLAFLLLFRLELFLALYGLLLLGTVLFFGAALVSWYRELRRLA